MSMDFTMLFAGPASSLSARSLDLVEGLEQVGFVPAPDFVRVDVDPNRGVFEEVEGLGSEIAVGRIRRDGELPAAWRGLAGEFSRQSEGLVFVRLYVVMTLSDERLLCFVDVSDRTLERLIDEGATVDLMAAYLAMARAIAADGAVGQYELACEEPGSGEVADWIHGIGNDRLPAQLALLHRRDADRSAIDAIADEDFLVDDSAGDYWILRHGESAFAE